MPRGGSLWAGMSASRSAALDRPRAHGLDFAALNLRRGANPPFDGRPTGCPAQTESMAEQGIETRPKRLPERTVVRQWRQKQFLALGFTPKEAETLTRAPVDTAQVRHLVAAGCPLDLVPRIVL